MNNLRIFPLFGNLCKFRVTLRTLVSESKDGHGTSRTTTNGGLDPNYVQVIDFDDSAEISIPKYRVNDNETMELRKSRLLYQSRKRGMLENGLLLATFAAKYLQGFNKQQTDLYDKLINQPTNDWEIYYWAIGNKPTPAEYDNEIMDLLKLHVSNPDRESRLRQPDL